MRDTWSRRCAALLVLSVMLVGGWFPAGLSAQGAAGDELVVTVSAGSCDAPSPDDAVGFTAATPEAGGGDRAAWSFATRIDQPLAELLAAPHVVLMERVDGDVATAFACGALAGDGDPDRVVVALESVETGGLAGVAVASANDDGGTSIVVFLMLEGGSGEDLETTPAVSDDDDALDESQEPDDERDGTEGGV